MSVERVRATRQPPQTFESPFASLDHPGADRRGEWPGRILVATDGSLAAAAAVAAAGELAEHSRASVGFLAIHEPLIPVPVSPRRRALDRCEAVERTQVAQLLRTVRAQRRQLVREPRAWPLRLEVGDPACVIPRVAAEVAADLVVMGIGRADPAERRLGGHTTVFAARQLEVPLYAAAGSGAPERCVIVLPDGRVHAPTIRAALACVRAGSQSWVAIPEGAASVEGEELDRLGLQRVPITGDMLAGVLRLCDEVQARLIAVPDRGRPGPVRIFLPNLAEPLLLAARCSVLVAPDQPTAFAD